MKFDLIVLGGGPAGYTGAIRAAKLGLSVALIEKDNLGGTCLNRGCIPTKALLHSANIYAGRNEWTSLGINADKIAFDERAVYDRKTAIVDNLRAGIAALIKANKIVYLSGEGALTGAHSVMVNGESVDGDNILIATGSSPSKLSIQGIENALTSDEVLSDIVEGEKLAIVGGGVIGMEFASYFTGIGRQVVVIEAMDKILPMFGKEISLQLSSVMKKRGVQFITGAKVTAINADGIIVEVGGAAQMIDCDKVIMATGRRANINGIGLDVAGVKSDGKFIIVDDDMRTNISNIYAAGDVIGRVQLAHYAAASAITAVESMLGKTHSIDLSVVPSCVYTSPEIAVVGMTDFEGTKQGKFLLGANGKHLINNSNRGFIKLFCDNKGTIRGGELFGDGVTELIGEVALAVRNGLTAEQVAGTIHAHPTVYESICEAAEDVFGLSVHKR